MGKLFKKTYLLLAILAFTFIVNARAGDMPPGPGELGDESWAVEEKGGRVFYTTHGTNVYGHNFGFYKAYDEKDILWLSLSSMDEKVDTFKGQDVVVSLVIDGTPINIKPTMLSTAIVGNTHVMLFTNWVAGPKLIDALDKGRYVTVRIFEPRELYDLMDIKEDKFGLEGFSEARQKANEIYNKD